jgi:hypothetical protein
MNQRYPSWDRKEKANGMRLKRKRRQVGEQGWYE